MSEKALCALAIEIGAALQAKGLLIATAESCTGGWVGQALTAVAGSSAYYDRGFITYSNLAKEQMLGVPPEVLARFGAVSEETVRAMAVGAIRHSPAQVALSISGVAGPGGGSARVPVGTVCFGWAFKRDGQDAAEAHSAKKHFDGDRESVRRQSVIFALQGVLERLQSLPSSKDNT